MNHLRIVLACVGVLLGVVGCGGKNDRSNLIDPKLLTELKLKTCDGAPCAADPCSKRTNVVPSRASQSSSPIQPLVEEYNNKVCIERPWNGYLLTDEIVKKSIEQQLDSIEGERRSHYESLITGPALKKAELVYYSDTKCQLNRKRFFFPRLSVMDDVIEFKNPDGSTGTSQGGYSIRVGNDVEEPCS